jgi:hypothetical protein
VDAEAAAARVRDPDRLDLRPVTDFGARAARVRRDRVRPALVPVAGADGPPPGAAARDLEQDVQSNGYLLHEIAQRYENDDAANVATVFDWRRRIASLTGAAIHDAAETYLDPDNYVQVTLMPETR